MKEVVLFPHSALPEKDFRRLLDIFGSMVICKPWYLKPNEYEKEIRIIYPDESRRPKEDFIRLLDEYKNWIQIQGKENALFFLIEDSLKPLEEDYKKLKVLIKKGKEDVKEEESLRWHLILHCLAEYETSQLEIDSEIERLKKESSPLKDLFESEKDLKSMFEDVISSKIEPALDERILRKVLEAWIGLFGSSIPKDATLVTISRDVFFFVKSLFEEFLIGDFSEKKEIFPEEDAHFLKINFPVLSVEKDRIAGFISGKNLIYVKGEGS